MDQEKPTPYSKRERRTAIHIAQLTPSGLKQLTEVAEASGVSRNEAVVQACENWVAERKAQAENKVKLSVPVDARMLARLSRVAQKEKLSVGDLVSQLVLAKIEQEYKKKPRGSGNVGE